MKEVILLFDNVVALVQECIVPIKYSWHNSEIEFT